MTENFLKISTLDQVKALVGPDLLAVEALVKATTSNIPLANEIIAHVVKAGGKRLRPITLLLWAKQFGYEGQHHIDLAAGIELVHTATLLHDDVVDESPLRRGQPTASALWGNAASVLTGDYLYTQSFSLLTGCFNPLISHTACLATSRLAEGELLQLINRKNLALTEEQYLHILSCKTGQLFELAAVLPGQLCQQDARTLEYLRQYGMNLGLAFQLMDDVLDYTSDDATLGKRVGDDLADGNLTLPLIYALQAASSEDQSQIKDILQTADLARLPQIKSIIERCGALDYTQKRVLAYTHKAIHALENFQPTAHIQGLKQLAHYNVGRYS